MKTLFLGMAGMLLLGGTAFSQSMADTTTANGKIGKMTLPAFKAANAKGGAQVAAITPTQTPLSANDQKLFMEVAKGGQLQLALSQAALDKVQTPEARILAMSEVEEQTGIANKLKEVADAKGITLPDGPDASAQPTIDRLQALSGKALDAFYVNESGVKGHIKLQTTMTKVAATAKDAALTKLAAATLPVIKMHLAVSTDVSRSMISGGLKKMSGAK